ncbi:GHMP family kinase ATP-binding protein [Halococcus agarilyticus]|uniref:GHMP family kinase ATP-binding protein n=1 Tax=Halococcus agarilyticus TaxID=1232219 RepID=UPI001E320516|nr:hypothetical protein [Halococcus agarilyticus]
MSFAIEDGVDAMVESSADTSVSLDEEPTTFEPVENVLRQLDVSATVSLTASVPVGYGFGASGAATLATALAANDAFDLERSREDLLEAAHRAEIEAGTGLGDVFIQDRGGLVWNTGDGPQRSELSADLAYTAIDGITTSTVLDDEQTLERVRECGRESLSRFSPENSSTCHGSSCSGVSSQLIGSARKFSASNETVVPPAWRCSAKPSSLPARRTSSTERLESRTREREFADLRTQREKGYTFLHNCGGESDLCDDIRANWQQDLRDSHP